MHAVKVFLCLLSLEACSVCSAAFAAGVADFDLNRNGLIEPGAEITGLLKSTITSEYKQIDTNRDGKIDATEVEAFDRKLDSDIADLIAEYNDFLADAEGLPIDEVQHFVYGPPAPASKPQRGEGRLLVRRDYENIGVRNDPKDPKTVQGAVVAYTRDYRNDNDIWQVRGSLMYLLRKDTGLAPTSSNGGVMSWSLIPGFSFDRLSNSNKRYADINSLTFRLGSEVEYMGGGFLEANYWRFHLAYATDFDFESGVMAAEVQWEPLDNDLAMGVARPIIGDLFEFRWRAMLHAEAGSVLDAGEKFWLVENEGFFRVGPKFHIDLWPLFADGVHLGLDWQYLQGFSGEPDYIRLFRSELSYALNKSGNYAIGFTYRNGCLPLTFEKVDDLTLGLSVKY